MYKFTKEMALCFILTLLSIILSIKATSVQDNEAMLDLEPLLYDYIQQHNFDPDVYDQHTFLMIKDNLTRILKSNEESLNPYSGATLGSNLLSQLNFYLPNPTVDEVSWSCKTDVMKVYLAFFLLSIASHQNQTSPNTRSFYPNYFWPILLYDSWGKNQDGVFTGNYRYWGFIDECHSVIAEDGENYPFNVNFTGNYCKIVSAPVKKGTKAIRDLSQYSFLFDEQWIVHKDYYKNNWNRQQFFSPVATMQTDQTNDIQYATCMPSSCNINDLLMSLNKYMEEYEHYVLYTSCQVKDQDIPIDDEEIGGIAFFSVLGFILLLATCAEIYCIYNPDTSFNKGAGRFLLAFSIWTNSKKIFSYDGSSKQVTCVHGIRALSLCWVIWGHQYLQNMDINVNIFMLDDIVRPFMVQTLLNATVSVDTFFMLSGLFITYGLLNQLKKTGRFNPLVFYIHRIVRLMPGLAFAAAFTASISTLIVKGPDLHDYRYIIANGCRRTWYLDVLFASNLVNGDRFNYLNTDGTLLPITCIGQSWYTSADTQMFAVMPFVVLPIFFWKKIGLALLSLYTLISVLIRMTLIWAYDMEGTGTWADTQNADNFQILYTPPWTRMGTYLVGAWAGYILYIYQDKKVKLSKFQVALGWSLSCICMLLVLYGIYPYEHIPTYPMPLSTTILYQGLHRVVWASGVAWVVIACHWGYGGFVNWLLSLPAFQPLSRLSFTMFLMAMPIQVLWKYSHVFPVYFSHYNVFQQTAGIIVVTIPCAWCLSLLAEGPIIRIEKILLGPRDKTTRPANERTGDHVKVELLKETEEQENFQENKGFQEEDNHQEKVTKDEVYLINPINSGASNFSKEDEYEQISKF